MGYGASKYAELRVKVSVARRVLPRRTVLDGVSQFVVSMAVCAISASCSIAQSDTQAPKLQKLVVAVKDENGAAVPNARVQLKGLLLTSPLRCETDFAGACGLLSPAGTYEVSVEKIGFYAASLPDVHAEATSHVDVTLHHQRPVREVVNVVESPPAIDSAQVASREELTGTELVDIPYPGPHDYRNALTFIPGSAPDGFGQFHLAGAETYQTITLLDGFNVTQPATGQLQVRAGVDAFHSITVEPSREPAENGKGSGGVLALNTSMGDNHLRFVCTDFVPYPQNTKGLSIGGWRPICTVAGPVVKGKVWFIDSLDGEYDNTIIPQLPRGHDSDQFWRVDNLIKLQASLTERNILKVSFLSNYLRDPHDGISALAPSETTPKDVEIAYIGSVKDQYSFESKALLETGFAVSQYSVALTPEGTAPFTIGSQGNGGNYFLNERTLARRVQGLANLYLAPRNWHGRHGLKIGIDVNRLEYSSMFIRQPISFLLANEALPVNETCLTVPPSPCARFSVFSGGGYSTIYNFEGSAYAEDRWQATSRLLVDGGVRLDWDEIVRTTLVSPRLAGTYILNKEGNTKFSAGVGTVYDATSLGLIAQPLAGQRVDFFFDKNGNPVDVNGNPTAQPVPVPSQFSVNRPGLLEPRYLNWSFALEQKLPGQIFLKAELISKRGRHGFAYNTPNGSVDGDFVLGNTRNDRYDAFSVSGRHAFRQRYAIYGAYTRSRARTNAAFDFSVDFPLLTAQRPGPYPWDVPNRFVGWGILPVSKFPIVHAFDVVYSVEARNGLPFFLVNDQQEFLSAAPLGSLRLPAYFSLNLAVEKRLHVFGFYWGVRGGFNNITNHQNAAVSNNIIDAQHPAPSFSDTQGRGLDFRVRLLGRN